MKIDSQRYDKFGREVELTGIFVRAEHEGKWDAYDIYLLDAPSLLEWLRSRGGKNEWAENVVGILLGHGHIASDHEEVE